MVEVKIIRKHYNESCGNYETHSIVRDSDSAKHWLNAYQQGRVKLSEDELNGLLVLAIKSDNFKIFKLLDAIKKGKRIVWNAFPTIRRKV